MQLKVLSLNLFEGGLFLDNIKAFIQQQQPDLLGLQEVYNGTAGHLPPHLRSVQVLRQLLPNYHYSFAPELIAQRQDPAEGQVELGNAIFSKYSFTQTSSTHFDIPYGIYPQWAPGSDYSHYPQNLQTADISTNRGVLRLINLHGIWGLDGGDNPRRLQMSKTIINQFSGADYIILIGDFNLKPNTQTIKNIEKHLTNVFKDELTTTFNMKHKENPGYATAVVDMMFTSPNIKIISHSCPNVDISDHLPLLSKLEL